MGGHNKLHSNGLPDIVGSETGGSVGDEGLGVVAISRLFRGLDFESDGFKLRARTHLQVATGRARAQGRLTWRVRSM